MVENDGQMIFGGEVLPKVATVHGSHRSDLDIIYQFALKAKTLRCELRT